MVSLPLKVKRPVHLLRNRGELLILTPVWVLALIKSATDLMSIPLVLVRIPLLLGVTPRRSSALYMNAFVMTFVVVILMYLRTLPPPCLCTIIIIYTAAVSRLNPALSIRAQRGASLPMAASWTEILHDLEEAESANAEEAEMAADQEFGDDLPDFDAADDDNVEPGGGEIKTIWTLARRSSRRRDSSSTWRAK